MIHCSIHFHKIKIWLLNNVIFLFFKFIMHYYGKKCHIILMICFSLLISIVNSGSLCVNNDVKCQYLEQPILNNDSSTFIEDFHTIRKSIKNVELYFSAKSKFDLSLYMRDLAGLTIDCKGNSQVSLSLTYATSNL